MNKKFKSLFSSPIFCAHKNDVIKVIRYLKFLISNETRHIRLLSKIKEDNDG